MDKTKEYSNYLIDNYETIKIGSGGRLMSDLKSFYNDGVIKDLIYKKSNISTKINILNIFRDRIVEFGISRSIDNNHLLSYEKFILI